MPFYVYILLCSDNSYYTGHTENLESRVAAHQFGQIPGYTQSRRPIKLVFSEEFPTREDALARERQLKKWSKAKKRSLIEQTGQGSLNFHEERIKGRGREQGRHAVALRQAQGERVGAHLIDRLSAHSQG
ncbi:MAG: GIY-YIG nuclease family protein [Chloroflexi bacterium]|nr:GIY-YIG nuclease family protein [Chloroflexota bacterium]